MFSHSFPFDPTYGCDEAALRKVIAPLPPADFQSFWQETCRQTLAVPLRLERRRIESAFPDLDVWEIEFDSLDGVRIGGWLTAPRTQGFSRGVVVGHGYGPRAGPDATVPGPPAAAIFPCARGFARSACHIPADVPAHVLYGIESRESYVHRGCAADIFSAASALLELFPHAAGTLDYIGGSFGGGIGALAVPWERRFRRAFLDMPSFGNHPLRLTMPCVGSGESVRQYHLGHPEVIEVLKYFDAATAAGFIQIPTLIAPALFDPAVPPPGQWAVYNAIPAPPVPKSLFIRQAAHFSAPGEVEEQRRLLQQLGEFFAG
ncbi:MAG TPA: acetylxylan esterase [Tepidisphaeraceae bacterium]